MLQLSKLIFKLIYLIFFRYGYEEYGEGGESYGDDSYEQELREYYSQREREQPGSSTEKRRDSRPDSPSYTKTDRFTSPSERYDESRYEFADQFRDTDSQSGDHESTRSLRNDPRKEYKDRTYSSEQYVEKFSDTNSKSGHDRHRASSPTDRQQANSPTNSDYSFKSNNKSPIYYQRTGSPSPMSTRERKGRSHRAQSPTTPTLDEFEYGSQAESSVDILSGKRDSRAKKALKHRDYSDKESDKYDTEDRTSKPKVGSRIISHVSNMDSDKHSRLFRSKEDLMDIDKSSKSLSYDRHWKSSNVDPPEKEKVIVDAFQTMRERKLEKQRSRSTSSSGSRSKPRDSESHKDIYMFKDSSKRLSDKFPHPGDVPDHHEHTVVSKIVKVDKKLETAAASDRRIEKASGVKGIKSDSEHDSGGDTGPGSDVSHLEHLKLELMKELSQLEEDGSRISANEEDDPLRGKKHKKPRLEDVFDLDVLNDPSLSMKRWRAKVLAAELAAEQEQADVAAEANKSDLSAAIQDPKLYRPLDRSKFKPIDAALSFRKQMEAIRKKEKEQQLAVKASSFQAKLLDSKPVPPVTTMDIDETLYDQSVAKSPQDIPGEFIPKKRRKVVEATMLQDAFHKGHRTYRSKQSEEYVSSGEEGDDSISRRHYMLHTSSEYEPMDNMDTKPDSKCDTNKPKQGYDGHETCSGLKDRKSDPRIEKQSSTSSVFHRDRGLSEPPIIPDSPIEYSDGKSDKRIPQEPRTLKDNIKREPMDLPLPRFASQFNCGIAVSPLHSPRTHISPKGPVHSPQMSPALPKLNSPPFSPGIHSPQMSPAIKLDQQLGTAPQMVPPPTPGDFPMLTLNTLAGAASTSGLLTGSATIPGSISPLAPPPQALSHAFSALSPSTLIAPALTSPGALQAVLAHLPQLMASPGALTLDIKQPSTEPMDVSPKTSPVLAAPPPAPSPTLPALVCEEDQPPEILLKPSSEPDVPDVPVATITTDPAVFIETEQDDYKVPEPLASDSSVTDTPEKPTLLNMPKTPLKLDSSSSELSDFCSPTSPGRPSLEDRIRALDEKLAQSETTKSSTSVVVSNSAAIQSTMEASVAAASAGTSIDYREKYRVRKKDAYNAGLTPLTTMTLAEQKTSEPSDFVRSILAKSSIFDQDSKRLSGTYDKYESSQEGHLNLKEAPHPQPVGLNKSSTDVMVIEDTEHEGLSRFQSSSSLVRQTSVPDNLPQYAGAARLANKLSPPPPPPPPPPPSGVPNGPHSLSSHMYASAISVSPLDPRIMNNILPAAGSLSGGSSPLPPPNIFRSGSLDSSPQLLPNSAGRLLSMSRRPSLEQLKVPVSSPYASHHGAPSLPGQGGPPDLSKVGQYGKDQPQPLPILNTSPTTSIPASVLMPPPPALKMVNEVMPRADAMRREHTAINTNREFLDPPILKQELKETELLSLSKHEDYNAKRKADNPFSSDCTYSNSSNKTEAMWDNLCKVDGSMKVDTNEPEPKKLKMSLSSSHLGEKTFDRKSELSSKAHASKDTVRKTSSKSSNSGTSNSSISASKQVERDLHSQKCDKAQNNSGKHGEKSKSQSAGSSSKSMSNPGQRPDHAKLEGKSDKLKSHKDKVAKKDNTNKEHKLSEKKDSKVKGGTNNSGNHGSVDGKHKGKDIGADEGRLKHSDKMGSVDKTKRPDKHKTQRSESKDKQETSEKGTPEKPDTTSDKHPSKKIEKEKSSGSSGRKHDSSHKHEDKGKNDKDNCEKSKERHKSGDATSKSKPNRTHSVDKVKDLKKPVDVKRADVNDHSGLVENKSSQDKINKSKVDSKDKPSKSSSKEKSKDSSKIKEVKKNSKNKSVTTPEKNSNVSPKGKEKQDDKSPIARRREKSGSHSEEVRSDQAVINQELFDQDELEMLAPFLSMYELVKTRSHKERDKPEVSKMDNLFGDYKVNKYFWSYDKMSCKVILWFLACQPMRKMVQLFQLQLVNVRMRDHTKCYINMEVLKGSPCSNSSI